MKDNSANIKIGLRLTFFSIAFSFVLAAIKFSAGIIGSSSALISDGVNSLGDIVGYAILMISLAYSGKKADRDHQYGHEKVESVVSLFFSIAIVTTGVVIGYAGILKLIQKEPLSPPTIVALIGAIASLAIKGTLYVASYRAYKKTHSSSIKALSVDHFSDAIATTGALVGIIISTLGFPLFDPLASLFIAFFVIFSGLKVLVSSFNILMDVSADQEIIDNITSIVLENQDVKHIDVLKTRTGGSGCYVDIEISCDKNLSLNQAHLIAEDVHDRIEEHVEEVRHVMVHTNPCDD
jgi:cation diffusion facilitator family transporter